LCELRPGVVEAKVPLRGGVDGSTKRKRTSGRVPSSGKEGGGLQHRIKEKKKELLPRPPGHQYFCTLINSKERDGRKGETPRGNGRGSRDSHAGASIVCKQTKKRTPKVGPTKFDIFVSPGH